MRVLVIEDDRRMAALLEQSLVEEGFRVTVCCDGNDGFAAALLPDFDVIVLDLMLPGMDGFQITQSLRQRGHQTPILILSARDAPGDVVRGLDLGADDYVSKPFPLDVLLARVRSTARRGPTVQPVALRAGPLEMNTSSRTVQLAGRRLTLTRTEYSILEMLLRRRNRVVTRTSIIASVWGEGNDVESNTLDAFMKLLRAKVEDPDRRLIHTVRGIGYILRTDSE
jgi:two-component system copper resistance phosphate regulon response regulator CusR